MSGKHISRYSEKLNLAEHRQRLKERRNVHNKQSNSLPPKYRYINNTPIIDIYSKSNLSVKAPYGESHSQTRLDLNEVHLSLNLLQLDPVDRIVLRVADERDAMQKRTFENWMNCHLTKINKRVDDIFVDLCDGTILLNLLQVLSNQKLLIQQPYSRFHCLENINTVLQFLRSQNIKLVNIHADDLVDGNPKLTLGLVWTIILFYQFKEIVQSSKSDDLSVKQILLQWSKKALENYPDIKIQDFSASWKDGKAFLALIHKKRPDLIDYKSVSNNSAKKNLEMAFNTAKNELGVPKIIEPEDVLSGNIDEKSMMTYVASLFEVLPQEESIDQKLAHFKNQYTELYSNLNSALKELNDDYDTSDSYLEFSHNRLESNFASYFKEYETFQNLFDDISKQKSLSKEYQKKFNIIANLWSKFETNFKEKNLFLTNESKKMQRSEKINKSLNIECDAVSSLIEKIKYQTKRIPNLMANTPTKEMNEYLYGISKELYDAENQINNMIISVQELKRDGYPADHHYRKIINMSGTIDKVKKEFEKIAPASSLEFINQQHYAPTSMTSFDDSFSLSSLGKWNSWIEEKNAIVNEFTFQPNIEDLDLSYNQFLKNFEEIKNSVDDFRNVIESDINENGMESYQSTNELKSKFNKLWTTYSSKDSEFKSYQEFLIKCSKSLNWMRIKEDQQISWQWFDTETIKLSEKQEKFKNLIDELEMKETSINEVIAVGTTLLMNNHGATNFIQKSVFTIKSEWQWILNLTHCLKTHLESLAIYEQFFYEAQEADNVMLELTDQLNARFFRPMGVGLDEGEILNREIRDMLDTIEDYKEIVNRLIAVSQNVSALSLRTTSVLPDKKVMVKAICSSKENPDTYIRQFSEGEYLQLINNSNPEMWKVCNSRNEILNSPAICFLITDISPQASQSAITLDSHWNFLKELWITRELQLREQVLYATMNVVQNWTPEDFSVLEPANRQKIVEILNQDAKKLLMDLKCAKVNEIDIKRFEMTLNQCNARFTELAHATLSSNQNRTFERVLGSTTKSVNRESLQSVEMQLDDLIKIFTQMQHHLAMKLASPVILDVDLLEEQVCAHKEFENELKNYEPQVNEIISFIKNGLPDNAWLKPKLEKMIDLWEKLWNEAHMFVVKLKSTEVFFSQLDEIDQIICEMELTLINQNESFPAGMDQIKILIAQLEAAQDNISSVADHLKEAPENLNCLINAVSMARQSDKSGNFDDIPKLKNELKSVEYRYDLLKNQIKKRLSRVNECSSQFLALKNDLKSIQIWMIGFQTTVKSQINAPYNTFEPKNVEQMEKKLDDFLLEISKYKPEIDEVNKSITYFLNLLQKYEDLFKSYQNEIQLLMGSNNQDYYGYTKRSRIQNARDWVTTEMNKLNNDFTSLTDKLNKKRKECVKNSSKSDKREHKVPMKIDTFESQDIEIYKFKEFGGKNQPLSLTSYCIPEEKVDQKSHIAEIISNLNRCQLSNLWYFSNLLSENFSPISIGDCFRFRIIKLDSTLVTSIEDEQSSTLEDSLKNGSITKKTYNILTDLRLFNKKQQICILDMMKLNMFNIFNGTINVDCFSEPLTIEKAISTHIIDSQLGGYLNCLMISSVELIHSSPTVIYAIYSAEDLKINQPLVSMSDSVDLNFFIPISENQTKFLNPVLKNELSYTEAIQLKYIHDSIPEISCPESLGDNSHMTLKEAIERRIFDPESGNIYVSHLNSEIPLHYGRQEGILCKPSSILQMVLEKDESSFLVDFHNRTCSINDAIKKGLIDGNSQFSIKPNFSKIISLSEAVSRGIVTKTGKIYLEKNNSHLTFIEAFNRGIIKLHETQISGPNLDILHPNMNQKLSLPEAIRSGIIDPKTKQFVDIINNENMTLQKAFEKKFISKNLLKDLSVFCGIRDENKFPLNILQAIDQDFLDLKVGRICDAATNRWLSINEAYKSKWITENQFNRIAFLTCPLIKFSIAVNEIAVNIEQNECNIFEKRKLYKTISAVYDSARNEYISLEEAQNRNFIDDDMGVYYHEKNNMFYSFTDAIDENFIQTINEKGREKVIELKTIKSEKIESYSINSVFNSLTKEWVSARQAVEDGIIDHLSGNYKAINEFGFELDIPINEAIKLGFIKATNEGETSLNVEYKIVGFKNPVTREILSPIEAIEKGLVDRKFENFYNAKTHQFITINDADHLGFVITEKLDSLDASKMLTLNELITEKLIDFDSGLISFPNIDKILSLNEAIELGKIDINKSLLKDPDSGEYICLKEAIEKGLFDPIRCEINDNYDNIITLNDAIAENLFPKVSHSYAKCKINFEEALERGYINLKTNTFISPQDDVEYEVDEAIAKDLLDPPKSSLNVYLTDRSNVIENKTLEIPNEEDFIDTKRFYTVESIKRNYQGDNSEFLNNDNSLSNTNKTETIPDRILSNITSLTDSLNENNNTSDIHIIDPNTGKKLTLNEAIRKKIYDPVDKMIRSSTNNNCYSWEEGIKMGMIVNSEENTFVNEENVIQRNCIVYNFYYIHKGVGVTAQLTDQMITDNQIDPINHTIKDPNTGTITTLFNGLENGSVFATILTLTNRALYFENLNQRHDNFEIINVYDPSINQLISYQDAINREIINIIDGTYTNPKTKDICTLSDALQHGLLHTRMKTRQFLPLSYAFTNVHIRTIEEEMNFSIPQYINEYYEISKEINQDIKTLQELSNTITSSPMMEQKSLKEKKLNNVFEDNISKISTNEAPEIAKKYIDILKDESSKLSEIEAKLLKCTKIYLNEKENQILLDECQDINNEFLNKQSSILSLIHQIECFVMKKFENIPLETEKELQELTNDLKSRTNQILKEINNRSRLLMNIIDEFDQFSNRLNDCNLLMEKLEQSIDSVTNVQRLENIEKAIVEMKSLDNEFNSISNDIKIANNSKIKFVDKINKFEESRKKFGEFLKAHSENEESPITEILKEINDNVNDLMMRHGSIHKKYKSNLSQIKDAFDSFENMKNKQNNIDSICDNSKLELDQILGNDQGRSPYNLSPQNIDQLHKINGEMFGISKVVKAINECQTKLEDSLKLIGIGQENIKEFINSIETSKNNFNKVNDTIGDLIGNISQEVVPEDHVAQYVDNLKSWLSDIDQRIKQISPLSLNQNVLNEQERLIQILQAEINGRQPSLESLLKADDKTGGTKISELEHRTNQKALTVASMNVEISELGKMLDTLQTMVRSCSDWISLSIELLSDRMFIRLDNEKFQDKLEEIKKEFKLKQEECDEIKRVANILINQSNRKDQNHIENEIKNLDKVWSSLKDLISIRSEELKNRQDYSVRYSELKSIILDKINNWEQILTTYSPIAIDLLTLQNQYENVISLIEDWTSAKANINDFCIIGSEYDSILQGFLQTGDQHYMTVSPQRRIPKLKSGLHIQTSTASASKPISSHQSGFSGSESSGVSSADYVNLNQEFSEVILEIDDVKSRYSEIGDRFLTRKSDITAILAKCKLFDSTYKEFSDQLDNQLAQLLTSNVETLNKTDEIAYFEKIEESVKNMKPILVNILSSGQDLLRNKEFVSGGVELKSNMNRLEKKYISLKDSFRQLINSRRDVDIQLKRFDDMKKSIENNIMRKERMLNVLGPLGTSASYGNAQLEQVNALIDEVKGLENDVEELNEIGQNIVQRLPPSSSSIVEIESALKTFKEKIHNLNKTLKNREKTLQIIMGSSKDFYKLIDFISDRLTILQEKIERTDENILTSFDWDEIQTELTSVKEVLQESENLSKSLLETTSDENVHYEIKNKITNLSRQCREIQWKIDHSVNMINKRSKQEDNILNKIEDAEKWINDKQELMKLLSLQCTNDNPITLSDNIRQLQILQGDIKHKKSQINDLFVEMNQINEEKSPSHKSKQIYDKLDGTLRLIENLENDSDILSVKYQKATVDLNKVNVERNKIEAWIDIEKHKMNKQYPVGLESVESEIRSLETTMQSIDNKHQHIQNLKSFLCPSDETDSKILLTKSLNSFNQLESDLNDLQIESHEKMEILKKLYDQIGSATDNLNYLKSNISKLEDKWKDFSKLEDKEMDISNLESEIKAIQADIYLLKPDLSNTKSLISSISEVSSVNAHLLTPELDRINDRCHTLSTNLAQKLMAYHSKHKAMNEWKNRMDILATRQKNLKDKVDNFPQSSLDLDSLEDQIQDLSFLNREVVDIEKSLIDLESEVGNLGVQDVYNAEKSRQKIENLNSINEQILDSIDDRQNSLRLQHNLVTDFETKKNELYRKLDEANNDPEMAKLLSNNGKNINKFTKEKVEPLKKQLEQVINVGNQACSTVVSGIGFKHIEQEIEQVKHNFEKLMQVVSDIENKVDAKLIKQQKFEATLKNLKEFVENISKDLKTEEDPSIEYHKSKSQFNIHKLLLDRLKKRQHSLEELNKIGSDILSNLKEPKKSQLTKELRDLNKIYERLLKLAEEKNSRYEKAVKLSKSFKDLYEPSLVWLETAEKNLANFDTSPTVDASEMEKRIQNYQNLAKEIKSREDTLEHLNQVGEELINSSSFNDSAAINNKINALRNYFEDISINTLKKMNLFESSIPIAERFLLANNKLDLVLPSLTALVRESDSLSGPMGDRNMEIIENETNSVGNLVTQARNDLDKLKSVDAFENSLDKIEDLFIENEKIFKEVLNEVTKKATKIGSNRTKAKIQEEKLEECLKVLSEFEQKIGDMSEKINNDYMELEECRSDFQFLHSSFNEHKEMIFATINDSKKLIRQAPGSDLKTLRTIVDRVKKQNQSVIKQLENQQLKLDEAIPLAKEYLTSYNKLRDWLTETEENIYQNKINNFDPDQLHQAEQDLKVISRKTLANSWEDQKPLLDIIVKSGQPLSQIVNRVQSKSIISDIEEAKKRYYNIKDFIKTRANDLEDIILINTELNEKVDQCANQLENIRDRINDCYQPSVHPEKLEEELGIFDEISQDLEKLQSVVDKLRIGIENCSSTRKKYEDPNEPIEILNKLSKISNTNTELQNNSEEYKAKIKQLLYSANQFWKGVADIEEKFRIVTEDLDQSAIEDLNTKTVIKKKEMVENLQHVINLYEKDVEKIAKMGEELIEQVDNSSETPDVEQAEEELKRNLENVRNLCKQKFLSVDKQQSMIIKLEEMRVKLDEWLKEQNNRLFILGPLPTETQPVLNQIERTKELKSEIEPKHREIELINQLGYQLTKGSHPNVKNEVNNTLIRINESWARLLDGLGHRQHQLQCILLSLGEFHRAVDEFMEWIISTENSLSNIKIERGDINSLEMGLAQHKMIRADMNIQQASVSKIERKAAEIIKEDVSSLGHEATQRLERLTTSWNALKQHIRIKHFELEDSLKEALIFYGDQQELLKNIDELENKLEVFKFSGGLPDTAKEQLKRFMDIYKTFPKLGSKIDRFLEDAKEIEKTSSTTIKEIIDNDVAVMLRRWNALKTLAESRKLRLEKGIETVESFHLDMARFINWLTLTEKNLNQQRPVSRIVDTILEQIEAHRALKRDITSHREEMLNLDKVATHLKYISQKHDIVLIRNLMSSIHHRWEKVVSRSSERSRNLDYGYKEAKRFEDMNKNLLDDIGRKLEILEQDTSIGQTSAKIREQIAKHKEFHCSLGEHTLTYDATRRLGYQLRDKAPIQECKKIDQFVHNLQMKWQNLCNKSIDREKALNDALLLSGNYKDAMDNLLSWLHAIEPKLNDSSVGYCGDINTVQNLISEHSILEKQLRDRDNMVTKINTDAMTLMVKSGEDSSLIEDQLAELKSAWTNINNLANLRRERLEEAKIQALQIESEWNGLKNFMTKSDHELRQFTINPEEEREEVIISMIENHEKFHQNLLGSEIKINNFQQLGHEILVNVHPDGENHIKHYINIIKSEWSELLGWSDKRSQILKEHLRKLNERKILLDDLLLWLATAEGTLIASENRENPCSLTEARFQYDEHERFINDMTLRQKEHDEIVTNSRKRATLMSPTVPDKNKRRDLEFSLSQPKMQDAIFVNPKVNQLHSKWKQVWFMILNRRKRLLDHIEYLKEVENMKHFNFDDWRRRYMSWMNHSKSRVMDFFRRQDTDHDGRVTRKEFIDGIIDSKFQTTRVEMEVVADIFDKQKSGYIDYRQFLAALRPERETYQTKPGTENEIIHDEVKKQVSKCTCNNPFKITQCGDGKYKFGDTEKLRLVRILRSNVMVRIGGGWCALDEFLVKHDPCRETFVPESSYNSEYIQNSKGRPNYELREKFTQPKGAISAMAPFKFKSTPPAPPPKKLVIPKTTTPRTSKHVTTTKTQVSATSPAPTYRRSKIPSRQTSQHSSKTSTQPQSRDLSPESHPSKKK